MDIADAHGVGLTMFLDWCEICLWGGAVTDVAREIDRRGHDVQLHAHLDFMPADFWRTPGIERQFGLDRVSPALAGALFDFLVEAHGAALGKAPVAFRGGGYRFNRAVLDAMMAHGVTIDSSVNVMRRTQPAKLPNLPQFRWSNGCIEVPVSCLAEFVTARPIDFNFSNGRLGTVERMMKWLDAFWREQGDEAIAVLVLHSWSLLRFDRESGWFVGPDEAAADRLDGFLAKAKQHCRISTIAEIATVTGRSWARATPTLSLDLLDCDRVAPDGELAVDTSPLGRLVRAVRRGMQR